MEALFSGILDQPIPHYLAARLGNCGMLLGAAVALKTEDRLHMDTVMVVSALMGMLIIGSEDISFPRGLTGLAHFQRGLGLTYVATKTAKSLYRAFRSTSP